MHGRKSQVGRGGPVPPPQFWTWTKRGLKIKQQFTCYNLNNTQIVL